jgi:acetyl-CoA C-acetyltransferase
MTDVYLLSGVRTPIGSFQGELRDLRAPQLGAHCLRAAVERAGIEPASVDEVLVGNVVAAGLRQAPARQAALLAGMPEGVGATTVNKVCGSGMKTVMLASDLIRAGSATRIVAGGMESMSNAPYLLAKARGGLRMGHGEVNDALFTDGLEDAATGRSMGTFAQQTADEHQVGRERMDDYAISSLERARAAMASGALADEIVPILLEDRAGRRTISEDEQPRRADLARIRTLRPAFKADGTITAASSSSISDGASALVVAAGVPAGRQPLARVVGHATHALAPAQFTLAPVGAVQKLLARVGWRAADVDLFEINEAFAMVTLLAIDGLGIDRDRVNIHGGACAQGHPVGSTGARLLVTLAHALRRRGGGRGIAALCIGGGEATAVAIEA